MLIVNVMGGVAKKRHVLPDVVSVQLLITRQSNIAEYKWTGCFE